MRHCLLLHSATLTLHQNKGFKQMEKLWMRPNLKHNADDISEVFPIQDFFLETGGHHTFSSTGHRPASLYHGPLSVGALTFSVNIFSETACPILMKFHRNVPAMVLFRIF